MRRLASCWIALVLVGCGRPAEKAAESTAGEAPAAEEMPAALSLADLAGTWDVRVTPEGGDSTLVTFQMVAGTDQSGWSFNFPKRKPVPVRVVAVEGDSVVTEAGPFESVLRKGKQVSTRTVNRLENGKLMGTTVATYAGGGPDSVVRLRFEGTRAP
jgi:hypothetical protein